MYKEIIDFEIRPIFNPSMEICEDFMRVQISRFSLEEQGIIWHYRNSQNFDSSGDENFLSGLVNMQKWIVYANLDRAYFDTWHIENNSFAFAAYNKEKMIGFISGALSGNSMFTRSLYVVPGYQSCGIGSCLLEKAERAAGFIVPNMELFPLAGADNFYQKHGYKNTLVLGRVMKTKKLSERATGVVPVFEWNNVCQDKLNLKINMNLFDYKHQPIFVYVNQDRKIDGIALRLPDGEDVVKFTKRGGDTAEQHKLELVEALCKTR